MKLNNNKIESIDEFKGLQDSKITKISVLENPFVEKEEDYKKILFEMLPKLTVIDGEDKNGAPVNSTEYDEEDGNSTSLDSWMRDDVVIKKCIERPVVQVSVICPDGHDNFKIFFSYNKILLFILILILF